MKATDLEDEHLELKNILLTNSKTPINNDDTKASTILKTKIDELLDNIQKDHNIEIDSSKLFSPLINENYIRTFLDERETKEKIVNEFIKNELDKISKHRGDWNLNKARIIFKAKDITRGRPIVSYFNSYGKTLGKKLVEP